MKTASKINKKEMVKYFKTLMAFGVAFTLFYSIQTNIFSEPKSSTSETNTKTESLVKKEKPKPSKAKSSTTNFDKKIDQFILDSGNVITQYTGIENIHPLWVTILLVPFFTIGSYLLGLLLRIILIRPFLAFMAKKIDNEKNKSEILSVKKYMTPLFIGIGLRIGIVPMESYFGYQITALRHPITFLIVVCLTLIVAKLVTNMVAYWGNKLSENTETNLDDQMLPILVGFLRIGLYLFGFLYAFSSLGVDMTPLIASLGALSFAFGFALKDSLSNFIGGIFLVMENAFAVGDKIDIDGIGLGFIHEIGLRTTKMKTFDNEIIVIPNNVLMNKHFKNSRLPDLKIKVALTFSVVYGTDIDLVNKIVYDIIDNMEAILEEPAPSVSFNEMGDFGLIFGAKFFVADFNDQYAKRKELNEKVYRALVENNIEIPYPTYSILKA